MLDLARPVAAARAGSSLPPVVHLSAMAALTESDMTHWRRCVGGPVAASVEILRPLAKATTATTMPRRQTKNKVQYDAPRLGLDVSGLGAHFGAPPGHQMQCIHTYSGCRSIGRRH
jgi:hypothetical protein